MNVLLASVTLSHEVLEVLGDPHIKLLVQDTTRMSVVDLTAGSWKLVHAAADGHASGGDPTRPALGTPQGSACQAADRLAAIVIMRPTR